MPSEAEKAKADAEAKAKAEAEAAKADALKEMEAAKRATKSTLSDLQESWSGEVARIDEIPAEKKPVYISDGHYVTPDGAYCDEFGDEVDTAEEAEVPTTKPARAKVGKK